MKLKELVEDVLKTKKGIYTLYPEDLELIKDRLLLCDEFKNVKNITIIDLNISFVLILGFSSIIYSIREGKSIK